MSGEHLSRFRDIVPYLKDCVEHLGYAYNVPEMEARKEFVELCRKVVKETETIPVVYIASMRKAGA